jgi:methyl coenzyme M reductase subunit C-like uncharacterized protein (methanogenesis marker protein 7)
MPEEEKKQVNQTPTEVPPVMTTDEIKKRLEELKKQ